MRRSRPALHRPTRGLTLSVARALSSEFARVYGVDFADVWQRGSQFKVEAMMFRIGKPESLLFLTPDKEEVRCVSTGLPIRSRR